MKRTALLLIAVLLASTMVGFTSTHIVYTTFIKQKTTTEPNHVPPVQNETTPIPPVIPPTTASPYYDTLSFSQSAEKLNGEATEYKILFHDNTTCTINMGISYALLEKGAVFYLIYLTNGSTTFTLHLSNEQTGYWYDVTTFRKHRDLGGNLLHYKNRGATENASLSKTIDVKNNDTWYLIIAVAKNIGETITVSFDTQNECMNASLVERTSAVTLSSAIDADFKDLGILNRYQGASLLNHGLSYGSFTKTIPVSNGGIVCCDMFNYINGMMHVTNSFGSIWNENYREENTTKSSVILTDYNTNVTKSWTVKAEALGFPRKASILMLVIDINPHSLYKETNWDGTYKETAVHKITTLMKNIIEKIFNISSTILKNILTPWIVLLNKILHYKK